MRSTVCTYDKRYNEMVAEYALRRQRRDQEQVQRVYEKREHRLGGRTLKMEMRGLEHAENTIPLNVLTTHSD